MTSQVSQFDAWAASPESVVLPIESMPRPYFPAVRAPTGERADATAISTIGLGVALHLKARVAELEPVRLAVHRLTAEERHEDGDRFVHAAPLLGDRDPHLVRVRGERPRTHPEHGAAPGHVVELKDPVRNHERMVVRERDHPGPEPDAPRALGRRGDEDLRAGDDLEAAGMVLADPRFVIIEPVEPLDELEVALDREHRVLVEGVKGREKNAKPNVAAHGDSRGQDGNAKSIRTGANGHGAGRRASRTPRRPPGALDRIGLTFPMKAFEARGQVRYRRAAVNGKATCARS